VRTLLDDRAALAGEYDVRLEAGGRGDLPLATGLYFYRIETLHGTARGRFMVLR
jgi:hypothetical protein